MVQFSEESIKTLKSLIIKTPKSLIIKTPKSLIIKTPKSLKLILDRCNTPDPYRY